MTINDLSDLAERQGHEIIYTSLPQTKSLTIYDEGKCTIGMDASLHGIDELEHLAHEMGHCELCAFYGFDSDPITRLKCEYRANKWMYEHLVSFEDLISAVRSGYTSVWDLADYFNLRPETMGKILHFYFGG